MQTWNGVKLIYPMVTKDYNLKPVKPVLMAEGAYEAGSEYGFEVTPLWVRRQAYYSYLAGAHHTYGHNDSWRMLPTWKKALDAPGAVQMGILKKIFMARKEWWLLVPDQSVFAIGRTDRRRRAPPGRPAPGRQMGHGLSGRQGHRSPSTWTKVRRRQGQCSVGQPEDGRVRAGRDTSRTPA